MNRPIRRVAFVAMMMFALLLANGTYMMIFRQSALAAEPQNRRVRDAEFAQDRGSILAAGKTEIAETEPIDDAFKYQRIYPDGPSCTRRSPATTPTTTRGPHWRTATTHNWPAPTTALFVRRLVDLATNRAPRGGQRADHDRAQDPGGGGGSPGRPEGGGGGPRPEHRGRAGHGHQPELRPQPDRQPRHRRGQQGVRPAGQATRPSAVQPGGAGDLPAGFDLQAGHRGGGPGRRQDRRTPRSSPRSG